MNTGPLGTVSEFIGGVLSELVFDGPFEGTTEDRLQGLWEYIVFEYEASGVNNRLPMPPLADFL